MLFNSYIFIFAFLPTAVLGCLMLREWAPRAALAYVSIASLVFYGYWEPKYLALLIPSLLANFALGRLIARTRRKYWLILGLAANLAVIGWFKYSLFLYLTATGGAPAPDFLKGIVLPLGISFITFQKIAYLVDVWRGHHAEDQLDRFAFFVLFFPQLIAGPIVLYRNIEPQILRWPFRQRYLSASFQVGLMFFAIGLFKKVVLADTLAPFANDVFRAASTDALLSARDAWIGALAYSLQLYFDFSGYSDMAVGLGRMFGFRLPMNFNSPYKARGIIDFWRRWHITLTSFFRNYVYISLGGNKKGLPKQVGFILIVFFLTGLWHGAGWTFVLWGCLHGLLVATNHLWIRFAARRWANFLHAFPGLALAGSYGSRLATLLCVVSLWVLFRADSLSNALKILKQMFTPALGVGARVFPEPYAYHAISALLVALTCVVLMAPNSFELVRSARRLHAQRSGQDWMPAVATTTALYIAITSISKMQSDFIYFNF